MRRRSARRSDRHGGVAEATGPALPLLRLMRLASPALPVGGFSYSEGLESAVDAGLLGDEAATASWLADQLHLGLARGDLAACAQAGKAWRRHDAVSAAAVNAWVTETRDGAESRQQTQQTGRSLAQWAAAIATDADPRLAQLAAFAPAPTWPVAFALAAVRTGAPPRDCLLAYALGWAENMVQAALKAVPLGQTGGQRVLDALIVEIPVAVERAAALPESARQAHTPMLAILAAQHETQYSRLFRS